MSRDANARVPPKGWRIRTRWTLRQGPPVFDHDPEFDVMREENGRVLYRPIGTVATLAPTRVDLERQSDLTL